MSKQSYTQMPLVGLRHAKSHGYGANEVMSFYIQSVNDTLAKFGPASYEFLHASSLYNELAMEIEVSSGDALHLYLPGKEFCDWLISCVPSLLPEYHEVLETMFDNRPCVLHYPTSSGFKPAVFMVPGKRRILAPSQDVTASRIQKLVMGFVLWENDRNGSYLEVRGVFDGTSIDTLEKAFNTDMNTSQGLTSHPSLNSKEFNGEQDNGSQYIKLIAGIALYTDCFPVSLVDGVPVELKHPSHHDYKNIITIGVVDKIKQCLGGTHASPHAHYRTGHFRTLRSERFVHKRFQTIWVDGVFVKGKSKTVLTPEEVDDQGKENTEETYTFATSKAYSENTSSRVLQGVET